MKVTLVRGTLAARASGITVLGLFEGTRTLDAAGTALDRACRGVIRAALASGDFRGRFLETLTLYPTGAKARRVLLVGLGKVSDYSCHRARLAAAKAARVAREFAMRTLVLSAPGVGSCEISPALAAQAAAEGVLLGHYRFTAYRSDPGPPPLRNVEIVEPEPKRYAAQRRAVRDGVAWAEAVCLARDLANTPGQDLVPERFAQRAREVARDSGARIRVHDVPALERLGMGALLAVGRGSPNPPRFIVLERAPSAPARGAKAPDTIVLIGKGVTFDTGGVSLKPREGMAKMKYDMSGAAAVLGVFAALPTLDLPFRVVGLIPSAENALGGHALKPGDVVRSLDGTTIEVTNTDAEGRLLLADALGYARRFRPDAVVDLATLTGAISVALGHLAAGLFTEDESLGAELAGAGCRTGERLWRMPLWDEYSAELRSDTADLVNSAAREGGAILAAAFLKHFARDLKWAHLDIASTAWSYTERPHEGRGPTGFGVRLLLEWLRTRAANGAAAAARGATSTTAPRARRSSRAAASAARRASPARRRARR